MDSKVLSEGMFKSYEVSSIGIFIDAENNHFVIVIGKDSLLYINEQPLNLNEYGVFTNAFVKDGHFYMAFCKDVSDKIVFNIQTCRKDGMLESVNAFEIKGDLVKHHAPGTLMAAIPVTEDGNSYCFLTSRFVYPLNPEELVFQAISGGHGKSYMKPFLTEIHDDNSDESIKLNYGGEIDETYLVKQLIQSRNLVHFLGFRREEDRAWGRSEGKFTPVILHHVAYDLKDNKVIQANAIYTDTPGLREEKGVVYWYNYGSVSMDTFGDNVLISFDWIKHITPSHKVAKSDIFFWEGNKGKTGRIEKIAEGFLPVLKADSLGDVHLLYVNDKANLMHKVRQNGVWQQESILINNVDVHPGINNIAAAFDKSNIFNLVYMSDGRLVYTKIKFD